MVDTLSLGQSAVAPGSGMPPLGADRPGDIVARSTEMLARNTSAGRLDLSGVVQDLNALGAEAPLLVDATVAALNTQLSPVERGELARLMEQVEPSSVPVQWADAGGAPVSATAPATVGLTQMQVAANVPGGPDPARLALDLTQMALDIVGIFEPTPFADGTNTIISAGRAVGALFSGQFGEAGEHAVNGVLSVAGVLPYLGDAAKLGKIGRWAGTVTDAVRMVADNPALRSTLEPALKAVHEALQQLPAQALDSLPRSAQDSLRAMRRQLDDLFAAGTRALVDLGNFGQTVRINGREVAIGTPPVSASRASDGRQLAVDAAGNEQLLRRPSRNVSTTSNADGTVTYTNTRSGDSVLYDANGFPVFSSVRADLYLPADKIVANSRGTHFAEANRMLERHSDSQLRAAGFSDTMIADVRAGRTPDGYTWHHHQDVGRMQLVRTEEHERFIGGHTGGWSLWGDGGRFSAR